MKAVVMAGGEGTRLRPTTSNQPKPMVPIVGKPCMEHILELLNQHGLEEVIVTVAFLPQAIRSYFGDGSALGVDIGYSVEESPLGTAGSVKLAAGRLDDTFLVISGDALCDVDLTKLIEFHKERGAAVTIGLKSVENPLEFGIVVTDDEGRIERFLEKPSWGQVFSDTINTGIYVLEPEVLKHVPTDRPQLPDRGRDPRTVLRHPGARPHPRGRRDRGRGHDRLRDRGHAGGPDLPVQGSRVRLPHPGERDLGVARVDQAVRTRRRRGPG